MTSPGTTRAQMQVGGYGRGGFGGFESMTVEPMNHLSWALPAVVWLMSGMESELSCCPCPESARGLSWRIIIFMEHVAPQYLHY